LNNAIFALVGWPFFGNIIHALLVAAITGGGERRRFEAGQGGFAGFCGRDFCGCYVRPSACAITHAAPIANAHSHAITNADSDPVADAGSDPDPDQRRHLHGLGCA